MMVAMHWIIWLLVTALVFVLGAIAGQWDTARIVRRRDRFDPACPDCRHYGSTCDNCASGKRGRS